MRQNLFKKGDNVLEVIDPTVKGIVVALVILAAGPLLVLLEKRKANIARELGFSTKNFSQSILQGLLLFAKVFLVLVALGIAAKLAGLSDTAKVIDVIRRQSVVMLFVIATVSPIGEELLFRGYLQKKIGVFFSSVTFAAVHIGYGSIFEVVGTFAAGMVFGEYARRTKRTMPTIIAHCLLNAWAIFVAYYLFKP